MRGYCGGWLLLEFRKTVLYVWRCRCSAYLQFQPKKRQERDMRKAHKRKIEETIRLMEEAHDEMKRCIERGAAAQVGELLADCQDAAAAMGTMIEDTEGEGHPSVTVLEEYCELVYQVHEYLLSDSCVNSVNAVNANKIYQSLRQKLIEASNSIRNDIKIRTEAVFLPYKASMWDSLESVWKTADADPDCDVYVIPIPYFDKNSDGSFKEEHYEGDQYPDYVPVIRYDAFDFGKHMPDAIYIHNGYDDWNLVTSVHPDFYSRNLKKYTEELIYIPYFVLGEIDPDNEQAAEGMKHFCFMPGIIYADKVIVQSENMKKIYVREYLKAARECGLTGKHLDMTYLEMKFLGTGSPKVEKVLNTKKEDLEIPDEWSKIIKKPDGTPKKIIFYNNSIGALLQHNEKMIEKIESVFKIFKENRNEIALLWRPHPLIESTLTAMRPQLWEAYKAIRNKYLAEGWGIYDDSADIDRAVAISDAYYGDGSSVVLLCQTAGMPVMVQDMENFMFADSYFFVDEGDLWLLTSYTDVLMHFSFPDMTLIEYFILPVQHLQKYVHYRLENTKEGIYILPHLADNIFYFDKHTKMWTEIPLPPLEKQFTQKRKIRMSVSWNGTLFLLGYDIPFVYFLDEVSGGIVSDHTYLDVIQAAGAEKRETIFSYCACRNKNKFYIPLIGQAFIFCMDLEERSFYCFHVTKGDEVRICTIDKYGDDEKFLLTTYDDEKIIWSPENGVEELRKIGLLNQGDSYLRAYHIGDKNYYIPANERKIYVEQGTDIREIPYVCTPNTKYPEYVAAQYGEVYLNGSKIIFQTRSGELFVLDTVIDEIHAAEFRVSSDEQRGIKKEILETREIPLCVNEQSCFCLEDYMKSIV